ncbi:dTMP kinase [Leadbettera azotonutricia]|uniref:Thymidylate kinase n=1 Tax=Leadbettera azotonutricia (strain ATCC BAA-888 / DSM 13862 / ZAS-9) TaxID=545695 RepID=F5YBM1_LEAAZ|nr:dTMP kinase [Leadbettera azotonutricia]AEF82818.1 dTMP kinase [Leadbettera azotonutricia ZAS-9]
MEILTNFAVFEGGDGSGTTTQLKLLKEHFSLAGKGLPSFYDTFEPTDSPIGRIIRSGLKHETALKPETIACLFAADRSEHLYEKNGIIERCARGELVVSDRYIPSSLVYQGITCGEELPSYLNKDFPCPEVIFFFDLDPETAQKRMETRASKDIFEELEFQIRVRSLYKAMLPRFRDQGVRIEIIDASKSPGEVAALVWRALQKMLIFKGFVL